MSTKQKWFLHIDWMINWLGFTFLAVCLGLIQIDTEKPSFLPWSSNPFSSWNNLGAIGIPVMYITMAIGCACSMVLSQPPEKKAYEWKKFSVGFALVWFFTMLSKWIAAQENVHSASIGDSIWAIFFGCLLIQIVKRLNKDLLHCLELSRQTELYIATSLVLLVLNFQKLKAIIWNSLFIAWIDTPILFVVFSILGVKLFRLRPKQSMILTGCTVICGSSAATAIRNSLKGREKDQKDAILISSLLTIPCIIILPMISKAFDFSNEVAGSWFGGCVDSTGAVFATCTQLSQESLASGAVVKMIQNVLIAPISVFVVAYYVKNQEHIDASEAAAVKTKRAGSNKNSVSHNQQGSEIKKTRQNSHSKQNHDQLLNHNTDQNINHSNNDTQGSNKQQSSSENASNNNNTKLSSIKDDEARIAIKSPSFNENPRKNSKSDSIKNQELLPLISKPKQPSYFTLIWERFPKFVLGFMVSILVFNLAADDQHIDSGRDFIFCVSEWFSTCSFVSIGMSLQLAKGDGKELMILTGIYLIIQITDIFSTFAYSYISYTYF